MTGDSGQGKLGCSIPNASIVRLVRIVLEDMVVGFSHAAEDSQLIEEMQLLLRNAGCQIGEINGLWNANTAAAIAVFCAVNELTAHGITPQLAHELLEYEDKIDG